MSRKFKSPSVALSSPRVPAQPASVTPVAVVPAVGPESISPAEAIWLDVFADAIVAMVLREANHG